MVYISDIHEQARPQPTARRAFLLIHTARKKMTDSKGVGLTLKQLADLHQAAATDLSDIFGDHSELKAIDAFKHRFDFPDALEIEIARQMSDKAGVPINEAFRLSMYTNAIPTYLACKNSDQGSRQDFWLAVVASRNTWVSEPRGSCPVTGFGLKEYWAEMHYTGSLGTIMGEISESIGRDQVLHPDADPARIFMANVSAADRRLRKRAAELGIKIAGNDFA
jgi:hypothetical protein